MNKMTDQELLDSLADCVLSCGEDAFDELRRRLTARREWQSESIGALRYVRQYLEGGGLSALDDIDMLLKDMLLKAAEEAANE